MRTCGICGCTVESGYWDPAPLGGVMVVCPACHRELIKKEKEAKA